VCKSTKFIEVGKYLFQGSEKNLGFSLTTSPL
jgi:hypothetical protein